MTPTLASPSSFVRRSRRRNVGVSAHADRARPPQERGMRHGRRLLGRYCDRNGRPREVIAQPGLAGSVLVVDRDVVDREDRRLVAHLAADEPAENAELMCDRYLEEPPSGRGRCRLLTAGDFLTEPLVEDWEGGLEETSAVDGAEPFDRHCRFYRPELLQTGMSIPELRWCRHPPTGAESALQPVSMREAIACLESYEPVRTITRRALALHHGDPEISTTVLRAELVRVQESPIVLNRRLREAALATIERQELSLSEIAIRCGRVKHDHRGNESGETSWLARRLGILPESGRDEPTPWVHSDVLALIARRGLRVSPYEVELG
jgi:hypothetical protein